LPLGDPDARVNLLPRGDASEERAERSRNDFRIRVGLGSEGAASVVHFVSCEEVYGFLCRGRGGEEEGG
jgi:hypothetical protein